MGPRIIEHRGVGLRRREGAAAVDVRSHDPSHAIGQPEQHPLVAGAHGQRLGPLCEQAGVPHEQHQHPVLPHLAFHVGQRVALGNQRLDHGQQVAVVEVAYVAELHVLPGQGCHRGPA